MDNKLKIVLQKKAGEKEHKKIDNISKKLQKIEKLKFDFETLKVKISNIRQLIDENTTESKNQLCQIKEKFVIALIDKFTLKSFTKWEKDIIISIINEESEVLMDFEYKSEAYDAAIVKFLKLQKENLSEFEMEMVQDAFETMLEEFDIELDDEDCEFDFEKFNDSAFKKRFEEKIRAKAKEQQERELQLEKLKRVEKTDIDFQKVYKKLAKLAHPDLHQSESEKEVKVEVMQRLTHAWNERDYYELLMLWLEIDPINTIGLEISEGNQKNIISQLNDTIKKIENEIYQVKFYSDDTAFYYQFNAPTEKGIHNKIEKYKKTLDKSFKETELKILDLSNTKKFKKVLKHIYDIEKEEENYMNDFESQFGSDFYDDDEDY